MKFCNVCQSVLLKNTATGELVFKCHCGIEYNKDLEDTLMYEEIFFSSDESSSKYVDFIDNAPFDKAGFKVAKSCPKCNIDYLTMIMINSETIYLCTCGFKITKTKYDMLNVVKNVSPAPDKP